MFRRDIATGSSVTKARVLPDTLPVLQARRLKQVLQSIARQRTDPGEQDELRARHRHGLAYAGASLVAARLPAGAAIGLGRGQDPWWRPEAVARHPDPASLTEDRRLGKSEVFLLKTETRKVKLLDGREFTMIREAFYDKAARRHFKDLSAITPDGKRIAYNAVPKRLMPLEGIDKVRIDGRTTVIVAEGYPAAEALRDRGLAAVGIMSGTFDVPSDRALDPLLAAGKLLLWPDNDSAGGTLMDRVAKRLSDMGAGDGKISVIFWRGGPRKGDAFDFDGDDEALKALIEAALPWRKEMRLVGGQTLRLKSPKTPGKMTLDAGARPPQPELMLGRQGGAPIMFEEDEIDAEIDLGGGGTIR